MPVFENIVLPSDQAIVEMYKQLEEVTQEKDQLVGLSPDQAFELGYRAAIMDFKFLTTPQENQ